MLSVYCLRYSETFTDLLRLSIFESLSGHREPCLDLTKISALIQLVYLQVRQALHLVAPFSLAGLFVFSTSQTTWLNTTSTLGFTSTPPQSIVIGDTRFQSSPSIISALTSTSKTNLPKFYSIPLGWLTRNELQDVYLFLFDLFRLCAVHFGSVNQVVLNKTWVD